jgi:hypothetical protein
MEPRERIRSQFIFVILLSAAVAATQFGLFAADKRPAKPAANSPAEIDAVVLHRLFREYYMGGEHFDGEETTLGDALGVDCLIQQIDHDGIVRTFRADGSRNEDWFGWNAEVLAPFTGVVEAIHINPVTNRPGKFGDAPASSIRFRRADGMRVMFAHVQRVRVAEGDSVVAGQVVAHVGNNGRGSCPHIHVGAWKDDRPYQIRWDLRSGRSHFPSR